MVTDVSEEHTYCIFRAEEYAEGGEKVVIHLGTEDQNLVCG
jgi:hypothetical protein